LLTEWQPSYDRGKIMQASLALLSCLFGVAAFFFSRDWRRLRCAAQIFAPWPWTMLINAPSNRELQAKRPIEATEQTRGIILKWGRLHAVRSALGVLAVAAYLWALN
jgi:hypothetical protein